MDAGSQRSNLGRDFKGRILDTPRKTWQVIFRRNRRIQKMATCVFFLLIPHVQSPAFFKNEKGNGCIYIYEYIYIYMCKHRLRTLLRNLRSTFKSQWKKHHPTFLQIFLLYIWKKNTMDMDDTHEITTEVLLPMGLQAPLALLSPWSGLVWDAQV